MLPQTLASGRAEKLGLLSSCEIARPDNDLRSPRLRELAKYASRAVIRSDLGRAPPRPSGQAKENRADQSESCGLRDLIELVREGDESAAKLGVCPASAAVERENLRQVQVVCRTPQAKRGAEGRGCRESKRLRLKYANSSDRRVTGGLAGDRAGRRNRTRALQACVEDRRPAATVREVRADDRAHDLVKSRPGASRDVVRHRGRHLIVVGDLEIVLPVVRAAVVDPRVRPRAADGGNKSVSGPVCVVAIGVTLKYVLPVLGANQSETLLVPWSKSRNSRTSDQSRYTQLLQRC